MAELIDKGKSLFADASVEAIENQEPFSQLCGEVLPDGNFIQNDLLRLKTRNAKRARVDLKKI